MRFVHLIVVAALVVAAVDVYRIKFESTVQAQRAAKLRAEIGRERDAIAALRAQWAQLDNPARIQALAQRHLTLKPIDPTQIDSLDRLPARPPSPAAPAPAHDPVAVILDGSEDDMPTGSIGTVEIASPVTAPGEAR
jgi:cell division protein FtsL